MATRKAAKLRWREVGDGGFLARASFLADIMQESLGLSQQLAVAEAAAAPVA